MYRLMYFNRKHWIAKRGFNKIHEPYDWGVFALL